MFLLPLYGRHWLLYILTQQQTCVKCVFQLVRHTVIINHSYKVISFIIAILVSCASFGVYVCVFFLSVWTEQDLLWKRDISWNDSFFSSFDMIAKRNWTCSFLTHCKKNAGTCYTGRAMKCNNFSICWRSKIEKNELIDSQLCTLEGNIGVNLIPISKQVIPMTPSVVAHKLNLRLQCMQCL